MNSRIRLTAHDIPDAPYILRSLETGKFLARREYADLACPGCKKLNERAAFERGLDPVPAFRCRRTLFYSSDGAFVGNSDLRQLLDKILPGVFNFYPIPSNPGYYVMEAKDSIVPNPGDAGFQFFNPCKRCGRFEERLLKPGTPFQIPDRPFVSIDLEGRLSKFQMWLFTKNLADELRRHKPTIKGMCLSKEEVTLE